MSIINNAHSGSQVSVMCMIYRVISENNKKMTVDDVIKLCRPENLYKNDNQEKKLRMELNFWMKEENQLWSVNSDNVLNIPETPHHVSPNSIAALANSALFSTTCKDLFSGRTHPAQDLFLHLSCILSDDRFLPYTGEFIVSKNLENIFQYLPRPPNSNERPNLFEYGVFLGFMEATTEGRVVDPTRAIKGVLPALFSENKSLTAKEFLSRLSASIPVFDGGKFRLQVEEKMKDKGWSGTPPLNHLSQSLSYALHRLNMGGEIFLDSDDDDVDALYLQLKDRALTVNRVDYLNT